MKKIIGFLKQSWFLGLLGVLALSLLLWYLGDLFGFDGSYPLSSPTSRLIAIGGLFTAWLMSLALKAFRARQKNRQMLQQLSEDQDLGMSPDEQATQEEVEQLDSNLQQAVQALQGMRLGKTEDGNSKQYLYELPWYIVIGPPGSGKTTLLANSELQFPLSDQFGKDALRGVGGTRNCDWWFTNEAVLLDTAGRYTTQDSNRQVDQGAWLGFLDLLKNYRKHQPVNGVVIAVSITDLLQLSAAEREQHAKEIRNRVAELYQHLNISIPVYVMFTKSDMLAGFNEFFDDLDKAQRQQVWGTTFPLGVTDDDSTLDLFNGEFKLLERRIHEQLLKKLENERSQEKRQAMYLFPQQFSSIRERVQDFLSGIFQDSKFHKPLMLRGVYFTSATQEGSPIDRIMSTLANSFGIARQQLSSFSGSGKSFFINKLLKDVIFEEAGLAGTNRKVAQKMQRLQLGTAAAVGLFCLLMAGLWLNSYLSNKKTIADYEQQVAQIQQKLSGAKDDGAAANYLEVLDEMRQLTQSHADNIEKPSIFQRLGLYQGTAVREAMDQRYEELLSNTLGAHAKERLESMIQANENDPNLLFGLLKAYLYLGSEDVPPNATKPSISGLDWNSDGRLGDEVDLQLDTHFNVLLQSTGQFGTFDIDEELVRQTQERILQEDPAKLAYIQFKNAAFGDKSVRDFNLTDQEGLSAVGNSFERKGENKSWRSVVPGLFTKNGFEKLFLPRYMTIAKDMSNDKWVLGKAESVTDSSIKENIQQLYQEEYIKRWSDFLTDMQIKSLGSKENAPEVLRMLTEKGGNLLIHILQAVQSQTDFSKENDLPLIGDALKLKSTLDAVNKEFKPLHKLLEEDKDKLADTLKLIKDLNNGVYNPISSGKEASGKVKEIISDLQESIGFLPAILRTWLKKPVSEARAIVGFEEAKGETKALIETAQEDLCKPCEQMLKGKYPFAPQAKKSVDIAGFTEFFRKDGTADRFAEQLDEAVNADENKKAALRALLKEAARVRSVFFSKGSLEIPLNLQLQNANPDIHQIHLEIGSIQKTFNPRSANRPKEIFKWPESPVRMILVSPNPAIPREAVTVGDPNDAWTLFRLVRNGRLTLPAPADANLLVQTPGLKEDPFTLFAKLKNLTACRCPK